MIQGLGDSSESIRGREEGERSSFALWTEISLVRRYVGSFSMRAWRSRPILSDISLVILFLPSFSDFYLSCLHFSVLHLALACMNSTGNHLSSLERDLENESAFISDNKRPKKQIIINYQLGEYLLTVRLVRDGPYLARGALAASQELVFTSRPLATFLTLRFLSLVL